MSTDQTKHDNFIDGQWVAAAHYSDNMSPSDLDDKIGSYAKASIEDAAAAIAAAEKASIEWGQSGLEKRKAVLDFIGNELIARSAEIGLILAREEGKTVAEGTGEVYRSGQFFHIMPLRRYVSWVKSLTRFVPVLKLRFVENLLV